MYLILLSSKERYYFNLLFIMPHLWQLLLLCFPLLVCDLPLLVVLLVVHLSTEYLHLSFPWLLSVCWRLQPLGFGRAQQQPQAVQLLARLVHLLELHLLVALSLSGHLHLRHGLRLLHLFPSSCPAMAAWFSTLPQLQLQVLRRRAARCP